ncbi:MAG: guanylate kinase [Chlamydiota bacterium]|nr:guanylate kinase [Chlamydiota bacterium]
MNANLKNTQIYVLSSPSGGGKTTLRNRLLQINPDLFYSVSCTTREPRSNEVEGKDYFFITSEIFRKRIDENGFIEFAQVFDHFYGTPKQPVDQAIKEGRDVILDLDPQGALEIKSQLNAILIYIIPPSLESLKARLFNRDTDKHEEILKRLAEARNELKNIEQYDYAVVNDRIEYTVNIIRSIMEAEKYKIAKQKYLLGLLQQEIYNI